MKRMRASKVVAHGEQECAFSTHARASKAAPVQLHPAPAVLLRLSRKEMKKIYILIRSYQDVHSFRLSQLTRVPPWLRRLQPFGPSFPLGAAIHLMQRRTLFCEGVFWFI